MGKPLFKGPRRQRGFLDLKAALDWFARKPFDPREAFRGGTPGLVSIPYNPDTILKRRNRLTCSSKFATTTGGWTRTNILSVTEDADGVGDLVVPNTTLGAHNLNEATCSIGVPNVAVVRAKAGGYGAVAIQIGGTVVVYFDLATGATVVSGTPLAVGMLEADDEPGYWDCLVAGIPTSTTFAIYPCQSTATATFAGDGTSGVYLARAQLETYTTTPTAYQDVTDWNTEFLAAGGDAVYLFQESTGVTPVTAPEQNVGLRLDTKLGAVRGPELVTNGNFAGGTTGWTDANGAVLAVTAGELSLTNTTTSFGRAYQAVTTVVGEWYELTCVARRGTSALAYLGWGTVAGSMAGGSVNTASASNVPLRICIKATSTTTYVGVSLDNVSGTTGTFDNVSLRLIPGNHLSQPTSGKRAVLTARVNLLTKTEQFDDSAYTKTDVTVTANAAVAPDGNTTADLLTEGSAGTAGTIQAITTPASGASMVESISLKRGNTDWVLVEAYNGAGSLYVYVNLNTGALGASGVSGASTVTAAAIASQGSGWYRITLTGTVNSTSWTFRVKSATANNNPARVNGATYYAWGADLRTADNAAKNIPAYQRVNTSTDYDTDGFPFGLKYDAFDDCYQTTLDLSATDKVTVWAGVEKRSDAAVAVLCELTANYGSNNGGFALLAPGTIATPIYSFGSRGSVARGTDSASSFAAPVTSVVSALADISGDNVTIRVNGVQSGSASTGDQGSGNFASSTFNVGSRNNGASAPFGGVEYGIVVRGAYSNSGSLIGKMERYLRNYMRLTNF